MPITTSQLYYRRTVLLTLFLLIMISAITFWGCEEATNSYGSNAATATKSLSISGTITYPQGIQSGGQTTAIRSNIGIPGTEIWLEEKPEIRTVSGNFGTFLLENVPAGNHRIVANIRSLAQKVYKKRSAIIKVSEESVSIGELQLSESTSSIRGFLRDQNGLPIANAILTLWGESFSTDILGRFVTPPLPAEISEAIISVKSASGFQRMNFPAFFSRNFTPELDITMLDAGSSRYAPIIQLTTSKDKLAPLEQVRLSISLSDPDEPASSKPQIEWQATHGTLSTDAGKLSASWTAPDDNVSATLTAKVTDSTGLTAQARLMMTVGAGGPGNQKPVISNVQVSQVTHNIGLSYDLSDPDNDPISIKVFFSLDNGGSFTSTTNLTGTSSNILPGSARTIIWESGKDTTQPAQKVILRIIPIDQGGEGIFGQTLPFALTSSNIAPVAAPQNLMTVAGNSETRLSWSAVDGAQTYNLYWGTTAALSKADGYKLVTATNSFNHTGLNNGSTYYYLVCAANNWGESPSSLTASATPLPPPPAAPSGLTATAGSTSVSLTWSAVDNATAYRLYWSNQPDVSKSNGNLIDDVRSPFKHTGLSHDTSYFYVITALNMGGESVESAAVSAKADSMPPRITNLFPSTNSFGIASNTRLLITFDEPVYLNTGNINIYSANGTLHQSMPIGSADVKIDGAQIEITPSLKLLNDTTYYVLADAGIIKDSYGNNSAAITSNTAWRFKTAFLYNETLQWNMSVINASAAWVYSTGEGVTIAVIDTGIETSHPEFSGQLAAGGKDFFNDGYFLQDGVGHGTHVSGIIAARGGNSGTIGVAPRARLYVSKVFSKTGAGPTADMVVSAVQDAVAHGAKIINMSMGTKTFNASYEDVAAWARSQGSIIFAASGNDTSNTLRYLAACPSVIAVGATNRNDGFWAPSNYGVELAYSAPGEQILSTIPGSTYGNLSGTSMATPHVAAVAALVWAKNPDFTVENVLAALTSGTVDLGESGRDMFFGHGRIDALKAVQYKPGIASIRANSSPSAIPQRLQESDFSATNFKPGELLIKLQSGKKLEEVLLAAQINAPEIKKIRSFEPENLLLISVPAGREAELGKKLQQLQEVIYAELNAIISLN